ncbi:MAG TPA: alpha/beta hydrolase [Caulobacteraceae bacterium]
MDADLAYQPRSRRLAVGPPTGPGEFAYFDYGPEDRAPDLVFLHANGFNARAYRTILVPLASELRILTPDQRGHGATTLATDRPRTSWYDLKDDLLAFLDAMKIERIALAGHSMGGAASLLAAGEQPDRVRALALFDPVIRQSSGPPPPPDAMRASPMVAGAIRRRRSFPSKAAVADSYRGRGAFRTWTDAMLDDYVEAGFHDAGDGTVELACSPEWEVSNYVNQDHDSWAAFDNSTCPIHILRATEASTGQFDGRIDSFIASGRVRLDVIPDTTHFLPMERPDLVRAAIREAVSYP